MVQMLVVQAGSTDFDEQGRIKGTLNIPLSEAGQGQVGRLIAEVSIGQPKVFRQLQDHPETVCPPQGEPVGTALERVRLLISRLLRKHRSGTVAIVVPEPLASFV